MPVVTPQTEMYFHTSGQQGLDGAYFQRDRGVVSFRLPEALFPTEDNQWGLGLSQLYLHPAQIHNIPTAFSMTFQNVHRVWPKGHYGSVADLLEDLKDNLPPGVKFHVQDYVSGRLWVELAGGPEGRMNLSDNIASVLGLPTTVSSGSRNTGTDLLALLPFLTVACDNLKPLVVNERYVRSLKTIPLGAFPPTQPLYLQISQPVHVPILEGEVASLTLRFLTRQGLPVRFSDDAQVGCALNLRHAPF